MNINVKNAVIKVKSHFERHAFEYAMAGVTAVCGAIAVERIRANDVKLFLTEKGLDYQEFINPESYKEKKDQEAGAN